MHVIPESPEAVADAVRDLQAYPDQLEQFGQRGRPFVEQHYSRQAQARQLVELLEALTT